jgi:transposase-like protein
MIHGETVATGASLEACDMCDSPAPKLGVYRSNAGFYIGYKCPGCGQPYSRESGYYNTREEAQKDFDSGVYGRA